MLDWRALKVTSGERSSIFPRPSHPTGNGRIVVRGLPGLHDRIVVVVFCAVEITAGQVVATDVEPFHH